MKAPDVPPGQTAPLGRPRFVLRYTWWYTRPRGRPTAKTSPTSRSPRSSRAPSRQRWPWGRGTVFLRVEGAGTLARGSPLAVAAGLTACSMYGWAARRDRRKRQ